MAWELKKTTWTALAFVNIVVKFVF